MLKSGILNPQLNYELSKIGHMDPIMVCDAGMPVPAGVSRVDLEFVPNIPDIVLVLENLLKTIVVEKIYVAEEIKTASPALNEEYERLFRDVAEIVYIPHETLKENSRNAKLAIKTGEYRYHYSTVLLTAGCAY